MWTDTPACTKHGAIDRYATQWRCWKARVGGGEVASAEAKAVGHNWPLCLMDEIWVQNLPVTQPMIRRTFTLRSIIRQSHSNHGGHSEPYSGSGNVPERETIGAQPKSLLQRSDKFTNFPKTIHAKWTSSLANHDTARASSEPISAWRVVG